MQSGEVWGPGPGGSGRMIMGRDYDMTHTNGMNHWFANFLASHILGKGWEALQPAKGQKPAPGKDADFVIKTQRLFSFATRIFSESTFFVDDSFGAIWCLFFFQLRWKAVHAVSHVHISHI